MVFLQNKLIKKVARWCKWPSIRSWMRDKNSLEKPHVSAKANEEKSLKRTTIMKWANTYHVECSKWHTHSLQTHLWIQLTMVPTTKCSIYHQRKEEEEAEATTIRHRVAPRRPGGRGLFVIVVHTTYIQVWNMRATAIKMQFPTNILGKAPSLSKPLHARLLLLYLYFLLVPKMKIGMKL